MKSSAILSALLIFIFFSACLRNPIPFDEAQWRKDVESQDTKMLYAPHFKDGKFFNPWMPTEKVKFWQFLKWKLSKKGLYTDEEKSFRPNIKADLSARIRATLNKDFIAWIGHGTFLLSLKGEYWLIDPMFSDRALLPMRITPPAIRVEELNELTQKINIIISHNHYDHLDEDSIRSLPAKSVFFVPKGLKKFIESIHGGMVKELDWWESIDLKNGTTISCLPAQHWSRRIGQPINSTLWASYMLTTPETTIYIGGDSGYFIGYKELGKKFPGIGYALLPLTAYHPRWFMHYAHMNAEETLDAFRDLGAKYLIPTQWGAFHLGDNPPGYPPLDLMKVVQKRQLDSSRIIIMDIGQIEVIKNPTVKEQ